MSYLIASRFVRRRYALVLALIGLLPDIDAILGIHRWVTHSLLVPLAAILIAIAIYRFGDHRLSRAASIIMASALIYAVHIVMDIFTAPTPILWPILNQSYAVKLDVEGAISSNHIELYPTIAINTRSTEFIRKPLIEGPLATPTGAIIALTIIAYEALSPEILRRKFKQITKKP